MQGGAAGQVVENRRGVGRREDAIEWVLKERKIRAKEGGRRRDLGERVNEGS